MNWIIIYQVLQIDNDDDIDDCEEFKEAVRILEKQKEDRLLLVQSKLNLLIENANHLAECEKRHME